MYKDNVIIEIYYQIDNFFNDNYKVLDENGICGPKKKRKRKFTLSKSEIATICILFYQSNYKEFKAFYLNHVCKYMKNDFPRHVSYNIMVELQKYIAIPLLLLFKIQLFGKCTGITYIDTTPLKVLIFIENIQLRYSKE